jgi:hypothetical protein
MTCFFFSQHGLSPGALFCGSRRESSPSYKPRYVCSIVYFFNEQLFSPAWTMTCGQRWYAYHGLQILATITNRYALRTYTLLKPLLTVPKPPVLPSSSSCHPALVSVMLANPCHALSLSSSVLVAASVSFRLRGPSFLVVFHVLVVLPSAPVVLQCPFAVRLWNVSLSCPVVLLSCPVFICRCRPLRLAPAAPVGCAPCACGLRLVGCWIR